MRWEPRRSAVHLITPTWANRQLSEIHDFRYVPTSCEK